MIFRIEPFVCQIECVAEYVRSHGEHFSEDELRTLSQAFDAAVIQVRAIILHRMNVRVEITEGGSRQSDGKARGLLDGIGRPNGDAA
ncbi:hypothetical protein JOE51_006780 [Bradyrhizobium japonicum]|nr:hypothetical protein [Bradyrhizobium japonicum]